MRTVLGAALEDWKAIIEHLLEMANAHSRVSSGQTSYSRAVRAAAARQHVGVLVDVLDALLGCGHWVVVDRHNEIADAQAGGGGGGGFDEADEERTLALRVTLIVVIRASLHS